MRICVVGCGAVGGLFAAHLGSLDDVEVFAYDLAGDHVAAINRSGLRLTGKADLLARVTATDDATTLPPCDFGIVATKSYATRPAIEAAARCLGNASVCSVQNGVGNEEILADYVGRVIRGTTFPAGHVVSPGVIEMDTTGDTWIGPFEGRPAPMDEVRRLADALNRAGMPTIALEDARGAQWTKLIFNAATNPIGALTGLSHGRLCEVEEVRRLVSGLVAEGVAVAAALGITLDSDPEALIDHAARVAYDHRASMLQDVQAGRRTEIDALNAGIALFGVQTGVPTPLDDAIVALIRGVERSFELGAPKPESQL
ncbi:MAG: ketopantoate reductase family protein [Candidatus Dormibacteria bacterium]